MTTFHINPKDTIPFHNNAAYCVGTGRMNLALRHEYYEQLKKVQKDIGFSYIRGHGLFCDDMAVYHTYTEDGVEKEEYNFQYIDLVFDSYLSLEIKPFVELGFMPGQMASGEQTVFWWKGNVTPPSDYSKWERLVTATVKHWFERYGREEVITWPFEVWNEPNLAGFWKDADMPEYFKLYDVTSKALKRCDSALRVGGPAICGVDDERWLRCFLEHCRDNDTPIDFVTRHAYGTEFPERDGHYTYQELREPEVIMAELQCSREIIDSFPQYKGMEMHITEFNTSYSPLNPVHDTNLNAAYIARLLSMLGDVCASYSYWTFGDVFEEAGVAFTPFSGCFGLLTNGMIPKPTYWTFAFYKLLYPTAVARNEHFVVTKSETGESLRAIAWNLAIKEARDLSLRQTIAVENGTYLLVQKTVDEICCNPLKTWIDMGSPAYPSKEQMELLKECSLAQVTTKRIEVTDGSVDIDLRLTPNALCFYELQKITPQTDRGYRPERIAGV